VGSFGHLAAQSLQGQKPLTGGEGGVFLTDDDELYFRAVAIDHYNVRCKQEIPQDHPLSRFAETGLGLKWRIHPLAAAMVEQQLGIYNDIWAGREELARHMASRLSRLPGLEVLLPRPGETSSWYALVLKIDDELLARLDGAALVERLHAEGAVEVDRPSSTRPLAQLPLFQDPGGPLRAYAGREGAKPEDYPSANDFFARAMKLPVWHREEDRLVVDQYLDAFDKVWTDLGI
jgi:dTDP-4-amino-4,6-dideoxygalactose transaminase